MCLYFSERHFTEVTVSLDRCLFSHLSLSTAISSLWTSLLGVLMAAVLCLLRDVQPRLRMDSPFGSTIPVSCEISQHDLLVYCLLPWYIREVSFFS